MFIAALLCLAVIATAVHEAGHVLAAFAVGQPVKSVDLLDNVVLQGTPSSLQATIINYSGGLFSALVLGVAYFVVSKRVNEETLFWLGVPLMFFSVFELGNGLIEGLAKVQYIEIKLFYPGLEYVVVAGLVTVGFSVSLGAYFLAVRGSSGCRSRR